MNETCQEKVWPTGSWSGYPCGKKGKVEHDGKWYCGIHSPEAKERRIAKSDERYRQYRARQDEQLAYEIYNTKAGDACRVLGIADPTELVTRWIKRSDE